MQKGLFFKNYSINNVLIMFLMKILSLIIDFGAQLCKTTIYLAFKELFL